MSWPEITLFALAGLCACLAVGIFIGAFEELNAERPYPTRKPRRNKLDQGRQP